MKARSDMQVLLPVALLVAALFAAGWGAVALSPRSSAIVGLGLLAVSAVTPLSVLRGRWALLLAVLGGAVFALVHAAESAREALPTLESIALSDLMDTSFLTRPSVWLPGLLAIPVLVVVTGIADAVRAQVSNLQETLRRQQAIAEMLVREDEESGALARRHALPEAENWIRVAQRYGLPLSIALVGVDIPPELDEQREGAAVLARALGGYLKETLRSTDVVARYDDHTFLLVLPGTDLSGGRTVLARTNLEAARRAARTVRGCVVQFLLDGTTLEELLAEAEAGLAFCRQGEMRIADRQLLASREGSAT